jgi:hypothetical protein
MNFKAQKITARTSQKEEEVGELPRAIRRYGRQKELSNRFTKPYSLLRILLPLTIVYCAFTQMPLLTKSNILQQGSRCKKKNLKLRKKISIFTYAFFA